MSSRLTVSCGGQSRTSQSTSQRRHRSRSTSRYADLDKPKKKKTLTATTSLVSIPNTIKLSMLNSGLLSFEKIKLEARDANNSLSQTIPDKPIELRNFTKLCEQRRKFPVLYKLEFQTAVKVETNTCRHATRKNNAEKNQNPKCIPYDYNRVVLEKIIGTPDSDYINASYVDSLLKPNAYIVTQGPTEETANDFWRMIWQENVSAIVMLTKTFDFTKVMCVQYWPPNAEIHETYGDISINIVKEEQLANFHIRTFRLYKKNLEVVTDERFILQFHYTEWYSHTCPFSNAVLEFRRRVRAVVGNIIKPNSMVGPMLVHCNDGGGRSGVYLAIDANLELAEEEDCFHVFGYLKKLRQSRKGLIENVEQYKFVYDTLEEHVVCGKTWFPVTELSDRLKSKAKKDITTKMNEYQKEYAQICKQTPRFTIGDCAGGHRADNREKNRDVLCVPPDNFRPYLTSFQGNAFTDYINSVFVDGYTKPREYIVTEWPLKHTLGEFWSLVYDHECSAVVVLCQPPPNSQQYPSFWPQKSKMEKYGPVFSVHFVSGKHYQNIKQWEFKINKKIISLTEMMAGVKAPTKTVQLFQLTCWPMGHKVPTSTNSLVFLMNMVELWRQRTDYGPVCVVSPDGRSRAGVYCAANACIEQVIQHGEVDVFQAVKTVRRHRPQIIENMTEYKYCYDLVLHYVLHFLDKEHKEKKFIAFGRGKCIPLTPENQNMDLPSEISNTGRIVVNKYINKIDKREGMLQAEKEFLNRHSMDRSGKMAERKKGRLYSLGGNEPQRRAFRGRLDRLKTVGTFDLGTEMSVLSEVAINLNRQILSGEMGLLHPFTMSDQGIKTASVTSSTSLSVQNSKRNTPEVQKRELSASVRCDHNLFVRSPSHETKSNIEFKTQHSADDCIQRSIWANDKKFRSLSTSSYLDRDRFDVSLHHSTARKSDIVPHSEILHMAAIDTKSNSPKSIRNYIDRESDKIEEDISSYEVFDKCDDSQRISLRNRKHMLRKSRRIIRTDSEIFSEGICEDSNEIVLKSNSEFQVHVDAEVPETSSTEKLPPNERNSSVASSVFSRKDSSDIDDAFFRKIQKSTDDSSKNPSTDEIDAVFSDSTTELERLEKEYKEIIKGNLQREYKSDGDTLDEVGKKRFEFGKWKNQSLEHEFELSNQELIILTGCQTLSSFSNETSGDVKDISRICSPESCTNEAYSDSGVRRSDNTHISCSKMRSRVYSSSRLGETPKEKERLLQDIPSEIDNLEHLPSAELCDYGLKKAASRPSMLEVKPEPQIKRSTESSKTSLFEKPFGRFRKVNKLLKCKRFSTSTLYDKKKAEVNKASTSSKSKDSEKGKQNLEKSGSIHLSKLSLFSQKHGKGSIFSSRKLGMFSSSSRSTNELFSKESNKGKLSEVSKSNTEISKSRISPSRFGSRKSSKNKKNSSTTNIHTNPMCHSPLSEEFYNKTGSVRLSAMELYEKFCSEDFGGLYKHEQFKGDERREGSYMNQHEYRLEKKGLRVIGRYNKNAMLFKQKSEPKFNFRPNTSSDYYQEEDEYYYNSANQREYGYYNEQDEYYGEYEDEYGDEVEGDYYVDEEGDFYEDEVELVGSIGEARFGNEPRDVACALELDSEKDLDILSMQRDIADDRKLLDVSMGCDSDVDEIYLMPEESKCPEYEKCGFENKQFTLEQSIIGRIGPRNISLDYLNELRDYEPQKDPRVMKSIDSLNENRDSDVLTIYKICSRESVGRSFDLQEKPTEQGAGIRPDSLQPAVLDYVKLTKSDTVIETSPIAPEFPCIEKAESLELLSNSSGTARTHSTLTEYAFDTVKNLNLDSCSTSKLSLSLKSEVFDDFAITPDDLKPIQNCEFEDFTLTPDGSLSETYQKSGAISSVTTDDEKKDITFEDEYKNNDVLIVDQFLINERKVLSTQESEQAECSMTQREQENQAHTESENIEDRMGETDVQGQHCEADATTSEFTIIDLYDDEEPTISLFTSELTKEFDRLFSKAEEFEHSSSSPVVEESISRTEIPSRYSMQRLEPYLITDSSESSKSKPEDLAHILDVRASTQSRVPKSRLRKNRSKSLNNLNKKTKCFPL